MDQAMTGSRPWKSYEPIKRSADLAVTLILLVLFVPLMAIVALLVKLDSKGPAFFRQQRVGKGGIIFRIIKFRTMIVDAESLGPQVTSSDDDRMTRLGRILRATKLDELPQLFNVVKGDMSLVGPRPQVEKYVERFQPDMREAILSVPPGITGPTAIAFRHEESILEGRADREEFYISTLLPIKCQLDCDYVRSQSFSFDCRVMLRTLAVFLGGIGHRILLRPIGRKIEMVISQGIAEQLAQSEQAFASCVVELDKSEDTDHHYTYCLEVREEVHVPCGE